ncbi:MAG TPA: hypothetical protein V6C91_04075 [Coleofasciculaceae cyanobacterium]
MEIAIDRVILCYSTNPLFGQSIITANREYNSRVMVLQPLIYGDEVLLKQKYYQLLVVNCYFEWSD